MTETENFDLKVCVYCAQPFRRIRDSKGRVVAIVCGCDDRSEIGLGMALIYAAGAIAVIVVIGLALLGVL